jgi:hypothetical protein
MCFLRSATTLHVKRLNTVKEDTMHPDIAYTLGSQRRAELLAEPAHQRLVREARQAGGRSDRHHTTRRWWWVLQPSRALASE